ncbi:MULTISPECIES: general stress protein [Tsukamurella]|uniref:Magnesium transporter n=1 Tax=Tsukamurella strandjordii TaxID=147577 RepID=A0AA90NE56_9ACTN|nr:MULTISPECIES: general stress protein [Tsukamurella]MDP0400270.1 magnesium transporter [Tsukamurella strandjordii]GIZ98489.1 membrane protein [Tsukamurella sp. TY48]
MSNPLSGPAGQNQPGAAGGRRLPTKPNGWPIGSYNTYAEAQRAVDYLSDQQFPVENVTIVGVDLMQVERITGRLTWGRVLGAGAGSGAWLGLFLGLLVGLFVGGGDALFSTVIAGVIGGVIFGLITTAVPYAASRGTRDFSSTMQLVAGRYDVLCDPHHAEQARDMLARLNIQ